MVLYHLLIMVLGIVLLNFGASGLVKGSARLAKGLGISPILIGLTAVAFGTSTPEFVVSLVAAARHQIGISFGNIVGSNIANIGLILGLSALISPLRVAKGVLNRELPILMVVTALLLIFSVNGVFSMNEGIVFCGLAIVFIGYIIRSGLKGNSGLPDYTREIPKDPPKYLKDSLYVLGGILLLLGGSHLVVLAGTGLMRAFGVSETVIGLTVIAVGTSLPELATSIVSVLKGETEICIGNVIGSNIFNTLFILGGVALFGDIHFDKALIIAQLVLLVVMTLSLFPILKSDREVDKVEGGLLLVAYAMFILLVFYGPALGFGR